MMKLPFLGRSAANSGNSDGHGTIPAPEDTGVHELSPENKTGFWQRAATRIKRAFSQRPDAAEAAEGGLPPPMEAAFERHSVDETVVDDSKIAVSRRFRPKPVIIAAFASLAIVAVSTVLLLGYSARQHEARMSSVQKIRVMKAVVESRMLAERKKPAPVVSPVVSSEAKVVADKRAKTTLPMTLTGCGNITSKLAAGEMLKRCIESYNAATGG